MGMILFVLIAIVAEILVWILVGNWVGSGWYVFFWFIAAFVMGLNLLRGSTAHIMPQMQQMQMGAMMGGNPQMGKHLTRAIAGLLLAIPGLISDVIAVLLLIPFVQNLFKNIAMKAMQKRQEAMMNQMMGGMMGGQAGAGGAQGNPFADMMRQMQEMQRGQTGGFSQQDSNVIDGEAREVTPDAKRINAPKDVN